MTLIEGPSLLADAIAAGAVVREVFSLDVDDQESTLVDDRALARLAGTESPRGPVAVVEIPVEWLDTTRNLVVAVGVSDPGNVGAIVRTAAAFGWGFAYTEGSADPWSPKAVRAGAGGQFQTPLTRIGSLREVNEWTTVATVVRGGTGPEAIPERPVALLVGDEANGLPSWAVDPADHRLSIAMPGSTESLNAAIAAGIAMYALRRVPGQTRSDV